MTTRTRKAPATTTGPAKKTTARKTTPAKRTARKTPTAPPVSLVKPRKPLPTRPHPFMTDIQGYATLAARIASIYTPRITAWIDHRDGTATRPLQDGTLHYRHNPRALTWQATCRMGAVHTYRIDSPSTAGAARVQAATCRELHHDLSTVQRLTADELEALGILQAPTWALPALPGEPATESIPVPLRDRQPRALADHLARSDSSTTDTQPLPAEQIAAGLTARADNDQLKEHPQP
jgi:hypothetical protein